jgi:uncharacterized membrane protein HdeD (DUF308 family)
MDEPGIKGGFMTKAICKVLGVVFLIVGLLGFVSPHLLGMHLSVAHNIIHLISAALALYFGFVASPSAARAFSLIFGAIYLLIGALGFITPGIVSALLRAHETPGRVYSLAADNIVHLLLGAIFLIAGMARAAHVTPITTDRGATTSHQNRGGGRPVRG